ncbi:hypothetical protein MFIFM68171_06674 [Madurella fahalii]|uniref:Ankyrin repeat protein n=1 Tax=Madurella fahalii TaxID=1157608 RepID=A0ABQ0GFC1_9PEZI
MGRPCTAAEIWQRDFMRHALARMYLYTTLSIEDISKILTIVAQNRIGSHLSSGTRSTSAQLKELLAEKDTRLNPHKLRPQSDEDARERATCWRSLKRYRKEKAFQRHHRGAIGRSTVHDAYQAPHCHYETTTDDDTSHHVAQTPDMQHVLLSWVQHALPDLPEKRCAEIRSLLSWRSSQSSTISRASSTRSYRGQTGSQTKTPHANNGEAFPMSQNIDSYHNLAPLVEKTLAVDWPEIAPWTDLSARADGTSWTEDVPCPAEQAVPASTTLYHSIIGKLCCSNRRDCLHRKVFATILGRDPTDGLATPQLTQNDFSPEHGRDMFGDTILHIAARWASVDLFRALHLQADPRAMNLRNVDGDTFMHVLGPLWIDTQPKALLEILMASCDQGFNFLARNLDGKTFFSTLLPPAFAKTDTTQLHDLTNSLQYLLLQTPSHILTPSLLAYAPESQPGTVADYLENLLRSHANTTTDPRTQIFALSVSRLFSDKVRAADTYQLTPPISAPNPLHQHLQRLQHLEHLSLMPWDAPPPGDVFRELLDGGADPNEYDRYSSISMPCTAAVLHHVSLGHLSEGDGVALVELLHRHGADLGLVTSDGDTPLHLAIRLGLPDAVATLVRLGADPMAFNAAGKSALCYPLVQEALLRERSTDSRRHARAHRVLVSMVDAAAKLGLPRPHNFLRAQEAWQ